MALRWRHFLRNPLAVGGMVVLLAIGFAGLLAPVLTPHAPDAVNLRRMLQPPGPEHRLGTDDLGRDVLSRLLYAGRMSLTLALGVAALTVVIGGVLGALAGFFGGRVDGAVSAAIDTLLSIPALALAMVVSAFVDLTVWRLIFLLALVSWPTVARLVRGQVLSLKEQAFAEASRAIGASALRTLFRHILPNTLTPVIVAGTLLVAYAILIESALSFLGFGLPPPTATWGGMLNDAQPYYREAPWLAVFPGLAITLVVASINFVGEGLRDAFDPRSSL
jgi:peptide/nickel transport system permease protein